MEQNASSHTVQKVADRVFTTNQLFQGISTSEDEKQFLLLSAQQKDNWSVTTSTIYSSKLLEDALSRHSKALIRAAEASDS